MGDVVKGKLLLSRLATVLSEEAQKRAPVKTGALRRTIKILKLADDEARVGHEYEPNIVVNYNNEKIIYPIFVHEGTAPHEIAPKEGKALAWGKITGKTEGGKNIREHVRRKVKHPGTKAQPYFNEAMKSAAIDKVISIFGNDLRDKISGEIDRSLKKS